MAQNWLYTIRMRKLLLLSVFVMSLQTAKSQDFPEGITSMGKDTVYTPEILKGDTVEVVFYVANLGKKPFWIFQVYASCQCTSPQYANDTFEPGRRDSVVLFFHSKNTEDEFFEKYALVLTPLGEKGFYIKGHMITPKEGEKTRPRRKIRITNLN